MYVIEAVGSNIARSLDFQAHRDRLTGILNLAGLERDLSLTGVGPSKVFLTSIDMDGLKQLNDRKGYRAGDEAIQRIASTISGAKSTGMEVYRLGGDEFVLISDESAMADLPKTFHLAASLGCPPISHGSAIEIVDRAAWREAKDVADRSMQKAKRAKKRRRLFRLRKKCAHPDGSGLVSRIRWLRRKR
jgi:diguanylate cyclase (GGDEF)-like protein